MNNRPAFDKIESYEEFSRYYWYREELSQICRQLGIAHSGTKQELNHNIEAYFSGYRIPEKKVRPHKPTVDTLTLNTPLLDCGFSFNAKFREFFSTQTGVENFKFTADMAAAWRKVKLEQNHIFTLQDMLDICNHKSDYAKYDHSTCEWNQFLKDFCADERNSHLQNKLQAASVLWNEVRNTSLPKVYSHDLVTKYESLLEESMKTKHHSV